MPAFIPPPKTCEVCGELYEKRPDESHVTFERKKTCSTECGAVLISRARSYDWQPKPCEWCGTMFGKRQEELGKQFSKRKCCSSWCQYSLMIQTRGDGKPSKSRYPREWNRALKEEIRARDDYVCQECGVLEGDTAHHVHHIDYVRTNLHPSNLITLCHSCHGKTCNNANKYHFIDRYQAMMKARLAKAAC